MSQAGILIVKFSQQNLNPAEKVDLTAQYQLTVDIAMSCCKRRVTSHEWSLMPLEEQDILTYEVNKIEFPRVGNWEITVKLTSQQNGKEIAQKTISYNYQGPG